MPDFSEAVRARLSSLRLSPEREAEIVEELSQHLEDRCRELIAGGVSSQEARRLALADFTEGDLLARRLAPLAQARIEAPVTPGVSEADWHSGLTQDLRYAARQLRKQPGFALLATLTLGLGIGATTAMISLVRALFFSPLAVEDASRLVELHQTMTDHPQIDAFPISLPAYRHYRDQARAVAELAAHYPTAPLHLVISTQSSEISGSVVSANYFSVLRLQPQIGRFFLPREDSIPGRDLVAVIGDNLWRRTFDADPRILGTKLGLNGQWFTIVGVMPQGFLGALPGIPPSDVWIPTAMFGVGYRGCDASRDDCRILYSFGRLAPDATVEAAQTEMDRLAGQLATASPEFYKGRGIHVREARGVRLTEQAQAAPTARILFATASCLLLMACANLAGLLLARNVQRRREVAIRLALGASRLRLLRQFLVESLVLALCGGGAGVLFAVVANRLLHSSFGTAYGGIQTNFSVPLDSTVLLFSLALSIGTALAFGLMPAWDALKADVAPVIKEETGPGGASRSRVRDILVIGQIAVSVMLLAGAGVLLKSLANALRGPGFDVDRVVMLRLRPGLVGFDGPRSRAYQREAVRRIETLQGVMSAVVAQNPPLPGWGPTTTVARVGQTSAQRVDTRFNQVGAGYFETLGIALLGGRDFEDRDQPETPLVAIVNETLARKFWPGARPIGETLLIDGTPHEIVGVVQDAQYAHTGAPSEPMLYRSFWQLPPNHRQMGDSTTHVRIAGDSGAMLARIREALVAFDADIPIYAWTLSSRVDDAFARVRVVGTLTTWASVLALFMSATGVYGLLSFAVNQRRREIAIRAALGGSRRDLAQLVVRHGVKLAGIGVVVGVISAVAAVRLLVAMLYGVQPYDPLVLFTACGAVAAMAIVATWLPVRRSMVVDPNILLRDS
jgi:macrolide transport system ATP-binding/permease protein